MGDYEGAAGQIREIVLRAASGQQHKALSELLDLTGSEDPPVAWMAAAAAMPGMSWEDHAGSASVMVERIVERFGAVVHEYDLPGGVEFDLAVSAGALYDGEDGVPRLLTMAAELPTTYELHHRLVWAGHMAEHGPAALMPLCLREPEDLWEQDEALLRRGLPSLNERETRRLWMAARGRSRADVLLLLHDAGAPVPDDTLVMYALAASLLQAERADEGEQVLLDARSAWYPLSIWETLPVTPVLNPGLRPLITARVADAYYTLPVGEKARTDGRT